MKIDRVCLQCGKSFKIYQSSIEKSNSSGKFCCRKCYNIYQKTLTGDKNNNYSRIKKQCANCGKEIFVVKSKTEIYKNNFCSNKCKYIHLHYHNRGENNVCWKGGHKNYRGGFDIIKNEHFKKKQICVICGTTHNIHIHHIIPYRLTKDNSLKNLIPLCNRHHRIIEHLTVSAIEKSNNYETSQIVINSILRTYQLAQLIRYTGGKNGKFKS